MTRIDGTKCVYVCVLVTSVSIKGLPDGSKMLKGDLAQVAS